MLPVVDAKVTSPLPEIPWLQLPGEPMFWYLRFMRYFLPLGPGRTVARAQLAYATDARAALAKQFTERGETDSAEMVLKAPKANVSAGWARKAKQWHWVARAEAFDRNQLLDFSTYTETARDIIVKGTVKAAQTLVANLDNPRLGVVAAKEILDRGGLPGSTNVNLKAEPYSADELNKAEEQLKDWEKATYGDSGPARLESGKS